MSLNDFFLEPKLPKILLNNEGQPMPIPSRNWGLDLSSQDMQKLKGYYHKLLWDCNLQSLFEANDILSEVQKKANEVNHSECPIKNPVPWAKKVGERIIFQKRRQEISKKKASQKIQYMLKTKIFNYSTEELNFEVWGELLTSALNELKEIKPDFYQIIMMRFFGEMSWDDISSQRHPDTEITKKIIDRERKKGSRALKKLREIFLSKL